MVSKVNDVSVSRESFANFQKLQKKSKNFSISLEEEDRRKKANTTK